ncbi:MAG: branched-chain amino acid ABC transporter permease [Rhodospirillales bacterium]|jgi:branched-chain amino acid transport system permease protein|nr:branched-chain amino acid ABC transporter permease [Rhodospirillales bacterium]MBT4007058.1 branched-chain amino acid ABC transporter permease [Rhodospirillales bacterium]MBT5076124.1 branched-chain amino acid ABC transporter permease [Rhodospirillales bacterium]MBT5112918.1 branched-chain amino acid ABC transporter permease [Rhodospirillales bacterium]MBT5673689.1 branched-chain amino acid ABC transporter permease [Rhodospirillales bacterium]
MEGLSIFIEQPVRLLQIIVDGILVGSVFALSAYGLALVWGVMKIINIAQGEFVMLGGYVAILIADAGYSPLLGVPLAAMILFCVGWVLYRLVIFRVVDRDLFISILATFGLSILLQQLANQVFGADVRTAESGLVTMSFLDGNITISQIKLLSFFLAFALGGGLWLFLRSSQLGQAIRATAQNARAARIMGIDTNSVYAVTYGLNAAICGAAGALVAMTWVIHPYLGLTYTVRSFMIVVVAGLGNLMGVILAGLGLGTAENIAGFVLGAEYQAAFVFSLLVVILVWRNWRLGLQRRYLK